MTDVRFCKVQFEKPPLAPERRPREGSYSPPGAALGAGRSEIPHVEGDSSPPGATWGPQARGGGSAAGTVEDSVGQQATLTSCQPGSDTPGPPVGLWAGDRPPSAQVRTIIAPQIRRFGPTGVSFGWPTSAERSGWVPAVGSLGLRGESRSRQPTRCWLLC